MADTKICPDCSCDYLAHVESCLDCGTPLLSREEHRRRQEERQRLREAALEEAVSLRQGELQWLEELHAVLLDSRISSKILADPNCGKGCRPVWHLLVSRRDAERAHHRLEEYFSEIHPEARETQERMSQGQCPACGTSVSPDTAECPDCGLVLLVIE